MRSPQESALVAELVALGCYRLRLTESLEGATPEIMAYLPIDVSEAPGNLSLEYQRRCPGCLIEFSGPRALTGDSLESMLRAALEFEKGIDAEDLRTNHHGCEPELGGDHA